MEVRNLRLIKNKDGHGTINYKICLPTKWVNFLELDKEDEVVVYLENNNIVIKSKEDFKMDEIIKNLKEELLNKKMTLLEMDNAVETISGSTTSLFDYPDEIRQNGSANYYIDENKEIVVEYETNITNKDIENMTREEKLDIEVTVTDVWEN